MGWKEWITGPYVTLATLVLTALLAVWGLPGMYEDGRTWLRVIDIGIVATISSHLAVALLSIHLTAVACNGWEPYRRWLQTLRQFRVRVRVQYGVADLMNPDEPISYRYLHTRLGRVHSVRFDKAGLDEGQLVVKVPKDYLLITTNGVWTGSVEAEDLEHRTYRSVPVRFTYRADAPPSRYHGKVDQIGEPVFSLSVLPLEEKPSSP